MRRWIVLAVLGGWSLACLSEEERARIDDERRAAQERRNQEEQARRDAEEARWAALPAAERAFCDVLTGHAELYAAADNDLKRSAVRAARAKALKAAVPGGTVTKWSATVKTLTTTSQGNAVLEMQLPCGRGEFGIGTWNNELSDIDYDTLIPIESKAFETLSGMRPGDGIWFNGRLVNDPDRLDGFGEVSITERGSMTGGFFLVQIGGR